MLLELVPVLHYIVFCWCSAPFVWISVGSHSLSFFGYIFSSKYEKDWNISFNFVTPLHMYRETGKMYSSETKSFYLHAAHNPDTVGYVSVLCMVKHWDGLSSIRYGR